MDSNVASLFEKIKHFEKFFQIALYLGQNEHTLKKFFKSWCVYINIFFNHHYTWFVDYKSQNIVFVFNRLRLIQIVFIFLCKHCSKIQCNYQNNIQIDFFKNASASFLLKHHIPNIPVYLSISFYNLHNSVLWFEQLEAA